jgi:hypothetical protein
MKNPHTSVVPAITVNMMYTFLNPSASTSVAIRFSDEERVSSVSSAEVRRAVRWASVKGRSCSWEETTLL